MLYSAAEFREGIYGFDNAAAYYFGISVGITTSLGSMSGVSFKTRISVSTNKAKMGKTNNQARLFGL